MGLVTTIAAAAAALGLWPSGERAAAQGSGDPVIFAAGDIACGNDTSGGSCKEMETSNLIINQGAAAILPLGDVQYEKGQLSNFQGHYHGSWGRAKAITRPAIGNHELNDPAGRGTGYWDYFNGVGAVNGPAGERGKGYYSYDLGTWHLIALNSNCSQASCSAGGAQEQWLRADLNAHPNRCTLVYMHHPRWTSDTRDFDKPELDPLIRAMYDHGVDVLLVGHSHFYERFAPQDPDQRLDRTNGIRHFIVGTGGRNVYGFGAIEPNSEVRNGDTFGVLRMELHPQGYDWRFLPVAGRTFTDSGSAGCHRTSPDTDPPEAPTGLSAEAHGANRVTLTWNPSSDVGTGIARYRIYRDGIQIGTADDTSYNDDTVAPLSTYRYHVVAEDGGGNPSPASSVVTATTPPPNQVITLTSPIDDAHVQAAAPTANAGAGPDLEVDGSPVMDGLLKFNVSGVGTREVLDARLRLHATDSSGMGGAFYATASNSWSEGTVTWNSAPAISGAELDSLASVNAGTWYEVDVTKAVKGDGPVSLRFNSTSSNGADYVSSEGTAGLAPQLRITVPSTTSTAPDTTITDHPPNPSSSSSAAFSFIASQSDARFECRLDGGAWQACTSPASFAGLSDGAHTFDVRAIGSTGSVDPTPARYTWTVDRSGPAVTLTTPVTGSATSDATPALGGAAGSAVGDFPTVTAKIYAGATATGSPVRTMTATVSGGTWSIEATPALADGTYTAQAEQTGAGGVVGKSATATFVVDTVAPSVPAGGAASAGSSVVNLTWNASTDADAVAGYRVYRDGVQIASPTQPAYTDSDVQPGTTYAYRIAAVDRAGNTSAQSGPISATTSAGPQVLSFAASHDTFVRSDLPTSNYGSDTEIEVDNDPIKHTLLKFPVTGVGARSVVRATLRLYNTNYSGRGGGDVRRTTSSTWSESTVTYATAPGHDATITGSFGRVDPGNWYEVDVTPLVSGDGTVSLKLTSPSTDGANYSSSEGPAGFGPELRVTIE